MMGTFLYFQDTNNFIGTTGCDALFSATINAMNAAPVPAKRPMIIGEFQAYASPPRFRATMSRVRQETRKLMPKRSRDLIAVRMFVA